MCSHSNKANYTCMLGGEQPAEQLLYPSNSALVEAHLKYRNQFFWTLQFKRDVENLEKTQQKTTRTVMALQHVTCEERLRKVDLFSSGNTWLCSLQLLGGRLQT